MHVAPGGGGGNSTNWNAYDVPAMWSMLEDFDTNPQWTHVGGWRKTFELTNTHLTHMRSCRDQLAASWPPEKNEASRVYLAELDKLIASVQATYDAAVANHEAMASATGAIATARYKLKPIYDRWQAHATAVADYEAKITEANSGTPAPMPGPPSLPRTWREDMNAEARAVMNAASGEIALASYRVTTPPTYTAPKVKSREKMPQDAATGPALVSPVIPPVVPRPASIKSPPPASASGSPVIASTPPYRGLFPVPTGPGTPTPQPSTGAPIPGIIGVLPVWPLPRHTPTRIASAIGPTAQPVATNIRGTVTAPGGSTAKAAARPMPGGVIGATPAVGPAQPAARPIQRVNPVGGIINGTSTPGTTGGSAVRRSASTSPSRVGELAGATYRTPDGHLVAISGMRRQRNEARHVEQWDPDNPWATEEGVIPVVEASAEPTRLDPGPAIGLAR